MLTYSWVKFIDMSLFTKCMQSYVYKYLISRFLVHKEQVSEYFIYVTIYIYIYIYIYRHSFFFFNSVHVKFMY